MRALKFQQMAQGASSYQMDFSGSASHGKSNTSTNTETEAYKKMTPEQRAEYDRLLKEATSWLDQGGLSQDPAYLQEMEGLLDVTKGTFQDILTGGADEAGLQNMLDMQRRAGKDNLAAMNAQIGTSANLSGGAGGSRSGIAQGLATSEANKNLTEQQNKTIYDWQRDQQGRQMQAAQGMGNLFQQYGALSDLAGSQSQRMLESLGAYKGLITGDMGGEVDETGSSKSKSKTKSSSGSLGFSDETMKKNIKNTGNKIRVSKTGSEINEKSFEWKDEAKKELGLPDGEQTGVLAQDVEKEDPSAVKEVKTKGKKKKRKAVDYSKLDKMWENI